MIGRYSTPEMTKIWSEERKYRNWIKVERAVNDALIEQGVIPPNQLSKLLEGLLLPESLALIIDFAKLFEQKTRHDVVAFVFALEERLKKDSEDARWIHYGMTSSDLVDTATAMAVRESMAEISNVLQKLEEILYHLTNRYPGAKIMGRTHGQYAEPLNLSDMFHLWYCNLKDVIQNIWNYRLPGKISGAVGDYKHLSWNVEAAVLKALALPMCVSSQIVPRHHHAKLISRLALVASTVENFTFQVRLYQQSGVEEMFEPFGEAQTGSSAMPHKRNPILCENVSGLARLMRGYVGPAMENIGLWHQRDISHSSVERVILPDAFSVLHFMLNRVSYVLDNLEIDESLMFERVEAYQDSQGEMLKLIREGHSRQEAYRMIQEKTK